MNRIVAFTVCSSFVLGSSGCVDPSESEQVVAYRQLAGEIEDLNRELVKQYEINVKHEREFSKIYDHMSELLAHIEASK